MLSHLSTSSGRLTKICYGVGLCLFLIGCCPKITSFALQSGMPGDEVLIRGSKFEDSPGENTVKFNGAAQWTANGVAVSAAQGKQWWLSGAPFSRKIVGDGSGGAIIAFQVARTGVNNSTDIYAQRVTAKGNL
jgi:hypothetical protein